MMIITTNNQYYSKINYDYDNNNNDNLNYTYFVDGHKCGGGNNSTEYEN